MRLSQQTASAQATKQISESEDEIARCAAAVRSATDSLMTAAKNRKDKGKAELPVFGPTSSIMEATAALMAAAAMAQRELAERGKTSQVIIFLCFSKKIRAKEILVV